jgi:hypothetical protein
MQTQLPHYKLSYFDIRGLAECARMQFALADVKYEDNRIARDKWPEIKKSKFAEKISYMWAELRLKCSVNLNVA